MKRVIYYCVAAAAVLTICNTARAGSFRYRFSTTVRQPLPWSATRTLDMAEAGGDIDIRGMDCSTKKEPARFESEGESCSLINVKGIKTCYSDELKRARSGAYEIMMMAEGRDGEYKIRTKLPDGWESDMSGEIDYIVALPVDTPVNIESVSGALDVDHVKGAISARTVSGDIDVSWATDTLTAESVTGSISVTGAPKSGQATTVTGAIRVKVFPGKPASFDISTVTGPVKLELPHGYKGNIEAGTTAGTISFEDANLDHVDFDGHTLRAGREDASQTITISTFSGSITITSGKKE